MKKIYPSILNLHSYQVLPDFDEKGTSKIFDIDINQPVTYGKTIFFITYKIGRGNKDFFLRPGSEIKCEVLDSRGKNIYTDFIPFRKVSGQGIGYIRIDDSLFERSDGWLIQDGGGTIILMGQLAGDSIPPEWRDTYNCRFEYPIKIHKELPNTSPLFFNTSGSNDFPLLDVHETLEFDVDTQVYPDETYKRSFANIVLDNLHTVGGRTNFSEISYNPVSASTEDNTILDTIPISSSEMLLGRIANVGISGLTDTGSIVTTDSVTDKSQFSSHSYSDVLLQNPSEQTEIARWFQWMQLYPQSSDVTKGIKSYPLGHSGFDNKYLEAIKIFRYAYEDEEYTIDFLGSGSFKLVVAESPHQNDLTASFLPGIDSLEDSSGNGNPSYNDQLLGRYDTLSDFGSGNLNVIYTQSIHDWDPYTASKWVQDTTKVHPSNIVSRSDGAYVRDSFTISSGSYASLHVMMSPHIGTSWSSSMKYISIRPKENSGSNVPFYYHKIQMPPRRRNEVINFNSKFLNPNMEVAQDLNQSDTNLVVSASNFFTGSPLIIEGDDGIFGGALRSRGYRGYTSASAGTAGAGFILYSGSVLSSITNEYSAGGVGLELHGGEGKDAFKFSTETGQLEITGSVMIEGVLSSSTGRVGGWQIDSRSLWAYPDHNLMLSSSGVISASNFYISETGNLTASNASISGSIFATDGVFSGSISAATGSIGGWTITSSSLFHSSSTNQLILSGTKGTIDMFSGSNAFPSLQIASDVNEDADDALASPGVFIQDGVIFLKRTSGSMPAGSIKGGVTGFQQVGTRIKPGFMNLFMSGGNDDSHQRLADQGSMFKLHGVNMNQSASGFERTRMFEIDWQADKGWPIPSSNSQYHYNIYNKAVTTSASLQGIYTHLDAGYHGQVQHMDPVISYLGWFESNEPTHSDLYRFQIKNSDFVISKQGEQDSPSDLHKHVWYRPMSQSFAISTMGSGPDTIVDTDQWSAIDAATSESAVGYLGNTYDYYPSLQIINTQKFAAAGEYSSSIPQAPLWIGRNYEGKITSSLYVSASGEVGIGSTTPHAELHVEGDISSSGNIDIAPNRFIRSTREDGVQRELLGYAGSPSILQINNSNNDRETRIFGEGVTVQLVDSGMNVLGNITASQNISASGEITSSGLHVSGTITGNAFTYVQTIVNSSALSSETEFLDGNDHGGYSFSQSMEWNPTHLQHTCSYGGVYEITANGTFKPSSIISGMSYQVYKNSVNIYETPCTTTHLAVAVKGHSHGMTFMTTASAGDAFQIKIKPGSAAITTLSGSSYSIKRIT